MPYVGPDGVRAEVSADIDFTSTEQTRETFNPDLPAVRSERLLEEERVGKGTGGVPGALSNEPPLESQAPEVAGGEGAENIGAEVQSQPGSSRKQTTRNYELDRTISHTKPSTGVLRRLSVAVVIRDKAIAAPTAEAALQVHVIPRGFVWVPGGRRGIARLCSVWPCPRLPPR